MNHFVIKFSWSYGILDYRTTIFIYALQIEKNKRIALM
jgi:hypothetical protein